jgi:hypothetical protein
VSAFRQNVTRIAGLVVGLGLGLAGGVSASRAAEEKASPAATQAAPAEDAITVARREFDAVKSARGAPLPQKGDAVRFTVPELHGVGAGSTNGASNAPKTPAAEKKSSNWLVEAMERPSDARKDRDRTRPEHERSLLLGSPVKDGSETTTEQRDAASDPEPDNRKAPTTAVNPLAHYLGVWMTPQDYALLKPGLEQSLEAGSSSTGAEIAAMKMGIPTLPGLAGVDRVLGLGVPPPRAGSAGPRENPFLATLNSAPSPSVVVAPPQAVTVIPVAPTALPATTMPPPQPAPVQSAIPDFAKPATDQKYFKQLKRF